MKIEALKIGIIGCGAIGSYIARICCDGLSAKINLVGLCDIDKSKAEKLVEKLNKNIKILKIDELIDKTDLIIEAASKNISASIAEKSLSFGKSVLIMSVGGLLDREDLFKLAEKKGAKIFVPSGALCGLDALKGSSMSNIKSVALTTKKPVKGLTGAPYLAKNNIDLSKINKETVLFEGNARDAIKGFPKNVNVAVLISLAGIGPDKTKVKIIASPSANKNVHEIEVSGDFGTFSAKTENEPFSENPKTSFLAALSASATLKSITSSVKLGT